MFVDRVTVRLKAGRGGAGAATFQKLRGKPRGRPTGGSGGHGGDVYVEADDRVPTLLDYARRPHRAAGDGVAGTSDFRHGRAGEDLVLAVPPGTAIYDESGTLVADLVEPGQRVRLLRGGRGGRGNAALVTQQRRIPAFAEEGEAGEEGTFVFEMKLLADAALIGFPNAGKSTLISRISAARPKIADYPFTTLEPNLGVVSIEGREFVIADIPGLIEGAAEGRGLGHEFLRHAERARALVVLLDPSPLQEVPPAEQYRILLDELRRHSADLAARPRVVALNKIDLPEARAMVEEVAREIGEPVIGISAVTGEGIEELLHAIADAVEQARRAAPERPGFVLHRPTPPGFRVRREGDRFVVEGRAAERAIALSDLADADAADLAARRLSRLGVDEALRRAGAQPGDEVVIGDLVFEFQEDEPDEPDEPDAEGTDLDGAEDEER